MRIPCAFLLVAALVPGAPQEGPASVRDWDERATRRCEVRLNQAVARGEVPGAVLVIGQGDRILHREAYGLRSVAPVRAAMTVDSRFDLASLTKPFTALAIALLADRGELDFEATAATYLPRFGQNGKESVTIAQLLTHHGGLIADNALADYAEGREVALGRIFDLGLQAPAGTRFTYSDVGYIVLGEVVEAVDGRRLDRFLQEEVFEPLGMTDTSFRPAEEARVVPTGFDEEGVTLFGVVHDPRARALGGVAGHAGLFSTATDLARLAADLLGRSRLLSPEMQEEFLRPRWDASGEVGRSYGFDVDTAYSSPRGAWPRGRSFGHTGFTGTSIWMDRESRSYCILLTSRLHRTSPEAREGSATALRRDLGEIVGRTFTGPHPTEPFVQTGAERLAAWRGHQLRGLRLALITNQTGRLRTGLPLTDFLHAVPDCDLVRILSPEHGFRGKLEGSVGDSTDESTGLPIYSLYGETRRPTDEMLEGLDAVVFDIADVGTRFYTYPTTLGYAMEECAKRGIKMIVLDRPNPLGGELVDGPSADEAWLSFIAYRPIPLVHGMTIGELARMFAAESGCELEVVEMEGWKRSMRFDETGCVWTNPSPNMRNPTQAILYPAIGLLEATNLSVGRGTDQPFELFGAPWISTGFVAALNALELPGVRFTPVTFRPDASKFEGERCRGAYLTLTDRDAFEPARTGLTIAWLLDRLHGAEFEVGKVLDRLASHATWEALRTTDDPARLPALWAEDVRAFREARAPFLIYD